MRLDKKTIKGYMLADGSVSSCFISPEESTRFAREEGITLNSKSPESYSKSYIVIKCVEEADPKFNRLQLCTNPPSFIELHPGRNNLMIEDYPALKFGFKQIDNYVLGNNSTHEYNGEGIISIDLSHFDASEMLSMDYMFHNMCLEKIIFGNLDTSHVTSMVGTFENMQIDELDLSDLDFSSVKDTSNLFSRSLINTVQLPKLPALKLCEGMFDQIYIDHIVFTQISEYNITKVLSEIYTERDLKLSFKGKQKIKQIESIIKIIEGLNLEFNAPVITCDFGENIKYKTVSNANGNVESLIALIYQEEKNASKCFEIRGSTITKVRDFKIKIAYVPDGITDIGEHAFRGCKDLEIVVLPESIERIHHCAFAACAKLERINIPDKVEYVGEMVFEGCDKLKHLYIPNSVSSCCCLGCTNLDFLRIPYGVWQNWISHYTKIKYLVIGLPQYTSDFDIRSLDEFIGNTPYITIEPFEGSSKGHDIDGLKVIDGMLIGITDSNNEDSFETVLGVFSIPKTTLSLPLGVEKICACRSEVEYLYIPETVGEINDDAFYPIIGLKKSPELVTKASNMEHLFKTLPIMHGTVKIHTI